MAVRTKLLGEGNLGTSAGGFYTVPDGETAILKQICVFNPTGGAATTVFVQVQLENGNLRGILREALAAGAALRFGSLFVVLMPGDSLLAQVNPASATATIHFSGTELEGVAD